MLSDGKQGLMVGYWWLTVFPGACIMLMVLSANLIGDWFRVRFDPQLRQLRQRITLWAKTRPLTLLETHGYVKERLRIAGNAGGEIFSPAAIEVVHRHAGGIPRIINLLCEHALISAFVEHSKTVSEKMVEEVAGDFDLREANREAPKAANSGGHPVLVDHPVPQNVKPSSMSFTKAAGEKKS